MTGSSGADVISCGTIRKPAAARSVAATSPPPRDFIRDVYYDTIRMSDDSHASAFRAGPAHRRHLRHDRGGAARLSQRRSGLVQPRPGPARDRRAARRAPAHRRRSRSRVDDQEYAPVPGHLGAARGDRRALQPALPARHAVAVHRPRTSASRAAGARRSRARRPASGTSTSATSCPTTRRTRSCSTSSRRSRRSRSCSRASAATPSPPTICAARCTAAASRRCCCRTRATRPASSCRARSSARWVDVARELDCTLLFDEFYSHYVWTGRPGAAAGRERRALRRGRRPRSGRHLRRAHQELALPGLARDLDGRPAQRRSTRSPARARSSTAAARSRCSARRSRCCEDAHVIAETNAIQAAFREKRDRLLLAARAPRRAHRPRARRHVLRLGQGRRAAAAAQRRHGVLPRGAREEGHHRAGRVLRRQPGQAPPASARRASASHVRFSFGPSMATLETALARLESLVAETGGRAR